MTTEELEPQIAKARSAWIGVEDHGILSASIEFDYGGSIQSIPGYSLDIHTKWSNFKYNSGDSRVGTAFGMEFIRRLMLAMGVNRWSDIPGRTVYVLREPGWNGMIQGIRPLPMENGKEFIFSDLEVLTETSKDLKHGE